MNIELAAELGMVSEVSRLSTRCPHGDQAAAIQPHLPSPTKFLSHFQDFKSCSFYQSINQQHCLEDLLCARHCPALAHLDDTFLLLDTVGFPLIIFLFFSFLLGLTEDSTFSNRPLWLEASAAGDHVL